MGYSAYFLTRFKQGTISLKVPIAVTRNCSSISAMMIVMRLSCRSTINSIRCILANSLERATTRNGSNSIQEPMPSERVILRDIVHKNAALCSEVFVIYIVFVISPAVFRMIWAKYGITLKFCANDGSWEHVINNSNIPKNVSCCAYFLHGSGPQDMRWSFPRQSLGEASSIVGLPVSRPRRQSPEHRPKFCSHTSILNMVTNCLPSASFSSPKCVSIHGSCKSSFISSGISLAARLCSPTTYFTMCHHTSRHSCFVLSLCMAFIQVHI